MPPPKSKKATRAAASASKARAAAEKKAGQKRARSPSPSHAEDSDSESAELRAAAAARTKKEKKSPMKKRKKQRRQLASSLAKFDDLSDEQLYAWAWDYAVDCKETADLPAATAARSAVIEWLRSRVPRGLKPPTDLAEVSTCVAKYRSQAPPSQQRSGIHSTSARSDMSDGEDASSSHSSSSESESQEEEEEESKTRASRSASRTARPLQVEVNGSARLCTHCRSAGCPLNAPASDGVHFRCTVCSLMSGEPADSLLNRMFANAFLSIQAPAASHAGQSDAHSSTAAAPRKPSVSLSAQDTEIERLIAEGGSYPLFEDRSPVTAAEALAAGRRAFKGTRMAPASARFIRLIQSGKLRADQLGWALPQSHEDIAREAASKAVGARKIFAGADGSILSSPEEAQPRTVSSLETLMLAFVSSIGPALFEQPKALAEWFTLLRTVITLYRDKKWEHAYGYLVAQLADKVALRESFGTYDERCLPSSVPQSSLSSISTSSGAAPPVGSHSRQSQSRSSDRDNMIPGVCIEWNLFTNGCKKPEGTCEYKHDLCCWKACTNKTPHRGRDCPANPKKPAQSGGAAGGERKAGKSRPSHRA